MGLKDKMQTVAQSAVDKTGAKLPGTEPVVPSTPEPQSSAPVTPSPADLAAAAGAPVRWDYKTVVMGHGFMGWHKGEINRRDLESQLDTLGVEGWELIYVWFDQKLHGEKDGHLMVFKRPIYR